MEKEDLVDNQALPTLAAEYALAVHRDPVQFAQLKRSISTAATVTCALTDSTP